ncbi:TonB-dependent receptor [Novosphingobium sp.]|uniref:TonB-dependent receptor domain-containing protein n=1 Tax=Novosphingobium sp. TaxID=1874826 RepID=UPI0025D057B0|nr:TonB-dependent receptor [Novosphingobium sp.]MCC6925367.1 TonB-dependent receptor [Novosphingobium sp.]
MTLRTLARGILASSVSLVAFAAPALAQTTPDVSTPNADSASDNSTAIVVTGSRLKQDPTKSALPLQIISTADLERNGLANPEQLNMFLTSNGSGADNLASNADVVTGAQRGTNGLSAANLRGQGSASTLILLNGRRVAAHGLSGGAVDVNQIPYAAIERVEILKDGASAIYGTDAIGGVINYITKKDFKGFSLAGSTDFTQHGGGEIYRVSGLVGYGDLQEDGINVMGGVAYSWNKMLRGSQRDFVNGNQPLRGLSVDTRGTPIATLFNIGANASQNPTGSLLAGLTLTAPNGGNAAAGGINYLDLPGGAGCESMDGGMAYDWELWSSPNNYYACAWDTGRAAVIQQPIETLTYYTKATVNLGGGHQIFAEVTGSSADSAKSFSHAQLSANTTNLPWAYPLNPTTQSTYDSIFNALLATFPGSAATLNARYGRPLSGRWRCIACGPREYTTNSRTLRAYAGIEGPLPIGDWDYKIGASHSESETKSLLGSGYYYRGTLNNGSPDPLAPIAPGATTPGLVGLINSGILNPFSLDQTAAALAGLEAVSANGSTLYGGRYTVKEVDASISGSLFELPGGKVQVALGLDWRRETYSFNGSAAAAANQPVIFLAAFDNVNALLPKVRTVKAAYGEIDLPILDILDITAAVRVDDYSGFGTTTNPKVSAKFTPVDWLMFRGSYSTGFRVPSFNQIFNGVTTSPYSGSDLADPVACPGGVPTSAFGSGLPCAIIRPDIWTGGNLNLGPETAKMASVGVVFKPLPRWSLSADWWMINVDNTIAILTLRQLVDNASLFPDNFIRDSSNVITAIDQRWVNAGSRRTQGVEFALRGGWDMAGGSMAVGLDGTLMLKKREKLIANPTLPYGPSQIGIFTFAGDLGLRWKHNAWISYSNKDFTITLTQLYRAGYNNQKLPGIASGAVTRPEFNEKVKAYVIYNLGASVTALSPDFKINFGIKNLFDTDPPFAITYDGNTGAGSSWEPRVADPRGRSFNVGVEVRF